MKFEHLQGSIVAMVTPFRQDGSVNFDMLTELLERQIAAGTDGILTLGTTGEYSTMSHEEDAAVVEHTIRVVDGRGAGDGGQRLQLHCHPDREEPAVPVHGGGCPAADLPLLQQG